MKKNVMMRIASVLMICVLISTCGISGTFAKYTSQATGKATARVAKWDVKVGDVALGAASKNFTFDLFGTIVDTVDGNQDDDVATKTDVKIIAPGTKGSFKIQITNSSEVNAKYEVTLDIPAALHGIVIFEVVGGGTGNLGMTSPDNTAEVTVNWAWPYENGNDVADTELGIAAGTFVIGATVTVTQVD